MESMTSDLIIGFLKGSLNEKEINQFYDWVNETPENKKIFFEAKMVYDACLSKGSDIDMDKSCSGYWKRNRNRLRGKHTLSSGKFRLMQRWR